MSHLHIVHDSDAHFTIDPVTREIINESKKVTVIQHDHNSERFTFSIQKQVEGHNMTACNRVEIHYINIDATDKTKKATGMYEADDLKTSSDDGGKVTFSWLLSRNATQYAGSLNFLIRFACVTDGVEEYAWNTAIFQSITVGSGMYYGGEEVIEPYLDVIAQWKTQLFEASDTAVLNVTTAETNALAAIEAAGEAKKQSVLDSIPDEYYVLQTGVDTLFNSVASGIRGNLSGSVVRADDVSPVGHGLVAKAQSKNLLSYPYYPFAAEKVGVTLSGNADGSITINGTSTASWNVGFFGNELATTTLPAGTYTFSLKNADANKCYLVAGGNSSKVDYVYGTEITFTLPEEGTMGYCVLQIKGGETFDNMTVYPQLERGNTATEYTPYIDPATVKVRRCGKNLIPYPYANPAQDYNGITFTPNDDGSVTINGTATNDGISFMLVNTGAGSRKFLPAGTYFLSCPEIEETEVYLSIFFYDDNNTTAFSGTGGKNRAFTLDKGQFYGLYFRVYGGVTVNNITVYPQIECGDAATSYEKYNGAEYTPGEDGVVPGVTSLSPNMTILTDTDGVIVECEYIVDTKTYINNKIEEALKGSEQK